MVGRRILNYKIESLIDEGGMGSVYEAVHMMLGRRVAIKVLNPLLEKNENVKGRFKSEAVTLSRLKHPNIVSIYEYYEGKDGIFLVMELLQGQPLNEYLDKISGPIPEPRALNLFVQMLDAIGYMHEQNIIHRDIKPANFIITPDDKIIILDFGIAKIINEPDLLLTKPGTKVGTALYMSPQQVKGLPLDRRTDIYSLGVTFFHMLTGQNPYRNEQSEYEIYNKIINEPFPALTDFYVGISSQIEDIIFKSTAKRPIDRYQTCQEFAEAIKSITPENKPSGKLLNTQIFDFSPIDMVKRNLNQSFWRNFLVLFTVAFFIGAIAISIYSIQQQSYMHVLTNKAYIYKADSITPDYIDLLNYGETVKTISSEKLVTTSGNKWIEVISLRGRKGYMPREYLADNKIFQKINQIFVNNFAQELTPLEYKWILWRYFTENKFFNKSNTIWMLKAESNNLMEFNTIANGDFNNNSINDFVCILRNQQNKSNKLLLFFDKSSENILIDFNTEVKIKVIPGGPKGGGWYLGNSIKRQAANGTEYDVNKYEYLTHDGLLVYTQSTDENTVYIFNAEENRLVRFVQPK